MTDDWRTTLLAQRQVAKGRLRALAAEHDAIVAAAEGANGDDEHDPEGATVAYERSRVAALVDAALAALQAIDAALARLDDGSYGTCASCGRPIDPDRLVARPDTATCVACAAGRSRQRLRRP